jgi:hypothetical protein
MMIAGALTWISAPVGSFSGAIGGSPMVQVVYVDKRELKGACVGGDSNVPLHQPRGNLMMVAGGGLYGN